MNTPPKFSHSRQGSVEHTLPTSSAAHLQHPSLSGHAGSGSHTPGHHSPLTHYGHALASLAYPSSSYSPYRTGQPPVTSWAASNPAALHSNSATPSASKRSQSREEEDEDDDEDDEDNSDDSDDDDDDEEEDEDGDDAEDSDAANTSKAKQAGSKRKRDASPKSAKAKKAAGAKGKAAGDKAANGDSGKDGQATKKQKPTRGARACTNCRRLKMRCVGAEKGPPCNRCRNGNHECIFEESNRGKKGGKNQKAEAMQQSLRKMEQTLATVLRSIRDPGLAAQHGGMVTRSPSPTFHREHERLSKEVHRSDPRLTHSNSYSGGDHGPRSPWARVADPYSSHGTHAGASPARISNDGASPVSTINPNAVAQRSGSSTDSSLQSPANAHGTRFLEPLPHHHRQQTRPGVPGFEAPRSRNSRGSPRLHSLPDNTLNPLGLLAEASLHNTHRARKLARSGASNSEKDSQRSGSTGGPSPGKTIKSEAGDEESPAGEGGAGEDSKRKIPLGVASQNYFRPGPMTILPLRRIIIEREMPPELLTMGIVTSEEVLDLFSIFFRRCTQHVCLLDAEWHTPTFICSRSPFLFTCVCTVAAKFYERRPDLHSKCLALTRKVAFDVVNRGFKSIEIVQGFLLMAMYAQPAERFEEDKTWMYSGIALRMATDLNLHRKSVATFNHSPHPDDPAVLDREREILNRERTWYVCFALDRGLAIQMGKPYTIREDWIVRNVRNWGSRFSRPWDLSVSAIVDLYRISSRQLDFLYSSTSSVSGLNTEIDYSLVLPVFNEQLQEWREEWRWRGLFSMPEEGEEYIEKKRRKLAVAAEKAAAKEKGKAKGAAAKSKGKEGETNGTAAAAADADKSSKYEYDDDDEDAENLDLNTRIMIHHYNSIPIRFSFAVLVLNSFGLQQAVDHPIGASLDRAQYFAKCLEAAKTIVVQSTGPCRRNMRYAPDAHILTLGYACVFLLKLIRPAFAGYVDEDSILALVQDAADMLQEAAVNETHTPHLYAAFLKALLQARKDHTTASKSATGSRVVSRAASPQAMDEDAAAPKPSDPQVDESLANGVEAVHTAAIDENSETVNWPSQIFAASSGMDDFWGSLLPPGFTTTSMHDLFGATTADAPPLTADAEIVEPTQHATKFGMGGGGAFDFGGGAIGNGNGGVPLNSVAASAALSMTPGAGGGGSGVNTPFGGRSRRASANWGGGAGAGGGGLGGMFDFQS